MNGTTTRALRRALAACLAVGSLGAAPAGTDSAGPATTACPAQLTAKATCYTGQDANGAHYALAVPTDWNGSLVVHAPRRPRPGAGSDPGRSRDDLGRWSVMVDEGYAPIPRPCGTCRTTVI